ncbi:MAG: adenylosuccinate lyase [Chloroflexi bacterium]|nr:adenylosuccinate lyase [Chloroflexota bacterium]
MIERYTRPEMGRIWSDEHKYATWLRVEIAACEGWAAIGAIPKEDAEKIAGATLSPERMAQHFKRTRHDVTAFLATVAETLGPEGRFVHMGLTSSDVWDSATSLQIVDALDLVVRGVAELTATLERQAVRYRDTITIGRTHGVHAEPTTFGFKLAVWVDEMRRNAARLSQARATMAVGKLSGAVGTHANVPPAVEEYAMKRLGLAVAPVSTQIIQRDRHAQVMTTLGILAASLEKFATEIRSLQRTEILEVEEPFEEGQTGSSAMPHKRNPELTERICGLSRVIRGHVVTALENVALWHERDISHSSAERIILPDSFILIDYMLSVMNDVVGRLQVYPEHMARNLELTRGLIFSQRVLTALIEKGLSRQTAYKLVQRHAMRSWQSGEPFLALLQADPEITAHVPPDELAGLFDYRHHLRFIDESFARLGLRGDE